jgi:8-oxo-dGTP pyrophosphatase MutT (NUDIX family)
VPAPDFVLHLRAKIGHDLLWLPAVTAVVFDEQRVLLVQRSDDGSWAPVTGIVDPGEHPASAAVREVEEETGVRCEVERLVWVNVTEPMVHVNGDHAQYLDHTFRCSYLEGSPHAADDESLAATWFQIDALPPMKKTLRERILTAASHAGATKLI